MARAPSSFGLDLWAECHGILREQEARGFFRGLAAGLAGASAGRPPAQRRPSSPSLARLVDLLSGKAQQRRSNENRAVFERSAEAAKLAYRRRDGLFCQPVSLMPAGVSQWAGS